MLSIGFPGPAPPMSTVSLLKKKPLSSIVLSGCILSKRNKSNVCSSKSLPTFGKVLASAKNVELEYGGEKERVVEKQLPEGLVVELMPKHLAFIMDGNRRWAAERDLPAIAGHKAGRDALKKITRLCDKWGVKVLTVYAFSTENWSRRKAHLVNRLYEMAQLEVDSLMDLFELALKSELDDFMRNGERACVIGNRSMLSKSLLETIIHVEEATKANSGIQINFAINYSGQYDILQACKGFANKVKDGLFQPEDINENLIQQELETKCTNFSNADLLIRTSGEHRISNFMMWQIAYSEIFFTDKLFPDFDEGDLLEAFKSFQKRQRRIDGHS